MDFVIEERVELDGLVEQLRKKIYADARIQVSKDLQHKITELNQKRTNLHALNKKVWEREKDFRMGVLTPLTELEQLKRAITISIYDAIVDQTAMWHVSQPIAEDFASLCRSFLFPMVYLPIMNGDTDYLLDRVPANIEDMVFLGRQFIKEIRQTTLTHINTPETWGQWQPLVCEWWSNIALPAIYDGAVAEEWSTGQPWSFDDMTLWNSDELTRALSYPQLWDMQSLKEHCSDHVMYFSGIPAFVRCTMQTRLTD